MTASAMIFSTLLAAMPAPVTPTSAPSLDVSLQPQAVRFTIEQRTDAPFVGIVLASLRGDTALVALGLPPLLQDYVVLGFGANNDEGSFTLDVPEQAFLPGIPIYAQGVTYDLSAFRPTDVQSFVLDASAPL